MIGKLNARAALDYLRYWHGDDPRFEQYFGAIEKYLDNSEGSPEPLTVLEVPEEPLKGEEGEQVPVEPVVEVQLPLSGGAVIDPALDGSVLDGQVPSDGQTQVSEEKPLSELFETTSPDIVDLAVQMRTPRKTKTS